MTSKQKLDQALQKIKELKKEIAKKDKIISKNVREYLKLDTDYKKSLRVPRLEIEKMTRSFRGKIDRALKHNKQFADVEGTNIGLLKRGDITQKVEKLLGSKIKYKNIAGENVVTQGSYKFFIKNTEKLAKAFKKKKAVPWTEIRNLVKNTKRYKDLVKKAKKKASETIGDSPQGMVRDLVPPKLKRPKGGWVSRTKILRWQEDSLREEFYEENRDFIIYYWGHRTLKNMNELDRRWREFQKTHQVETPEDLASHF